MFIRQPGTGNTGDPVRDLCRRQNLDLGITGKVLKNWRGRRDGLELDLPYDISINDELHICTRMVGRPEYLGANLSPVCVHAINIKQFVVDALDIGSDATKLLMVQSSYISREIADFRIAQSVRRPPQSVKHQSFFNRPEPGAVVNQPLQCDRDDDGGAARSLTYCGAAIAEIAIRPISVLQ